MKSQRPDLRLRRMWSNSQKNWPVGTYTIYFMQLRPYIESDVEMFPTRDDSLEYAARRYLCARNDSSDMGGGYRPPMNNITWKPYQACKSLHALDGYCALQNVREWKASQA